MRDKKQRNEEGAVRNATDRFAVSLADRVLKRPKLTIALVLALVILAAAGVTRLEFSNNYRVFFGPDNPELIAFDEFQDTYTKNDNIMFVVKPAQGSVFTPQTTEAIEWLTAEAWKIPYAIRVDSVTNFQHSWANGDDLTVEDLIRDGNAMSAGELAKKQEIAMAEPLLRGNLISLDADTTGINVTLQYPEESLLEVRRRTAEARRSSGSAARSRTRRRPGRRCAGPSAVASSPRTGPRRPPGAAECSRRGPCAPSPVEEVH